MSSLPKPLGQPWSTLTSNLSTRLPLACPRMDVGYAEVTSARRTTLLGKWVLPQQAVRGERGLMTKHLNVVDHKSNYLKPLFHPSVGIRRLSRAPIWTSPPRCSGFIQLRVLDKVTRTKRKNAQVLHYFT